MKVFGVAYAVIRQESHWRGCFGERIRTDAIGECVIGFEGLLEGDSLPLDRVILRLEVRAGDARGLIPSPHLTRSRTSPSERFLKISFKIHHRPLQHEYTSLQLQSISHLNQISFAIPLIKDFERKTKNQWRKKKKEKNNKTEISLKKTTDAWSQSH